MMNQGHVGGGRTSSIETGTKLYISNLDYGVSNEDIKVNFVLSICLLSLFSLPRFGLVLNFLICLPKLLVMDFYFYFNNVVVPVD